MPEYPWQHGSPVFNKRVFSDSEVCYNHKLDGNLVLHSCWKCSRYKFAACQDTSENILHPVTGPVGSLCPLPDYTFPEDEPAHG